MVGGRGALVDEPQAPVAVLRHVIDLADRCPEADLGPPLSWQRATSSAVEAARPPRLGKAVYQCDFRSQKYWSDKNVESWEVQAQVLLTVITARFVAFPEDST